MSFRLHRFLTDKSLLVEGREAGWYRDSPQPFAEPGVQPHYTPDRAYVIERIDLELWIDPGDPEFRGEARVTVAPTPAGMGEVALDLDEVEVAGVEVDGAPARWRHADGKLRISGLTGRAQIAVRYSGRPRLGLYYVGPDAARPDRRHEVWSQCQDEDGHYFFPCFDHPSVKHPYAIAVNAPAGYTVVSNGRLEETTEAGGWRRWSWREDQPMPAYLVTVVVAELATYEDHHGDLPVRYLVPPRVSEADARRIFGDTPQMIGLLERTLSTPFPWPRYDQVIVHDFIFGGMENAGATTLTDACLVDERAAADYEPEFLVMHELAHQWFGDLVTCQDWSQGWLNEGWATYSETLWAHESRGPAYATWYIWQTACDYFSEADGRYSRPLVTYDFRAPIDVFDRHLYEKGACVLHTLRHELGEGPFWAAVAAYLAERGHGTAHTRHFQAVLERTTGRNLDGFFRQWVFGAGFPDLTVKLSHGDGLLTVAVDQKQDPSGGQPGVDAFRFTLRVAAVDADGEETVIDLPVRERSRAFTIPLAEAPAYVRVDPGYRVLSRVAVEAPSSWLERMAREDGCPVGRIRATRALVKQGSPAAIKAALAALAGEAEWFVRASQVRALASRRDAPVRDALLAALDGEPSSRVRAALVDAVAGWREPAVAARLEALLASDEPSYHVAGAAARSLGRMRAEGARAACEALL